MNQNLNEIKEQKNQQNDNIILNHNNIPLNNNQQSNQNQQLNLNNFNENNYLQRQNLNNLQINNNCPQRNINYQQNYNNLINNNNNIIIQQNENLSHRNNNNQQNINPGQPGNNIYQNQNINFQQPEIFRNGSIEFNELTGYYTDQSGIYTNLQGYSFSAGIYSEDQASHQIEPPIGIRDSDLSFDFGDSHSSILLDNEEIVEDLQEIEMTDEILNKNKGKNCCICLNEYIIGEKISYLPCFHLFHFTCIKEWVKNSDMCPLCKEQIKFDK